MTTPATTAYKQCEKRWKAMDAAQAHADPELIDVRNLSTEHAQHVRCVGEWQATAESAPRPILALDGFGAMHEGFYIIPGAIDAPTQLGIAHACLTEYVEAPHVTNMHQQHEQVPNIWQRARECQPNNPSTAPLLAKLHWAACGYHYEWTARQYMRERWSPVPTLLAQLAQRCAQACGERLTPEAVIVNFYKQRSTMGGHQDDVELTMDHPVVSLSLGTSAVFLKGGCSKDVAPLQVLLRSGDVALLGGNSRLSFHGVAKVLPSGDAFDVPHNEWTSLVANTIVNEVEELVAVRQYLATQRININVRQVFPTAKEPVTMAQHNEETTCTELQLS